MSVLDELKVPIVQAPLGGGPSTPALAGAVSEAGGLGFLAAGYRTPDAMVADVAAVRALTRRPFGVNVFAPSGTPADPEAVRRYADALAPEARRAGVALGSPRFDDDRFAAKVDALVSDPVAVVSFTFGCPRADTVARLRAAGSAVWVTVTGPEEAEAAVAAGADALVLQGAEAGGHRASFTDRPDLPTYGILSLLQLVAARAEVPLVAAGGIATGRALAAVLAAGAAAGQLGSAFMRCPEAGTSAVHRAALATPAPTELTRAFSGRLARGIVNRLLAEHRSDAPIAYPEVHHLTAPLRARARETGDRDLVNLWAGEAHELAEEVPVAEVVARVAAEAAEAAARLSGRLPTPPR